MAFISVVEVEQSCLNSPENINLIDTPILIQNRKLSAASIPLQVNTSFALDNLPIPG